ncbi:MAG: hypothetical protein NVV60_14455 [Luteimonas sp.]|nr:hypothetical protein [Luteimonas sp.]
MHELLDGPLKLSPAQVRNYAAGPMKSGLWLLVIGVLTVAWGHLFAPTQEGRDIARIIGYATAVLGVLSYGFGHLLLAIGKSQHRKRQAESTTGVGDEA